MNKSTYINKIIKAYSLQDLTIELLCSIFFFIFIIFKWVGQPATLFGLTFFFLKCIQTFACILINSTLHWYH